MASRPIDPEEEEPWERLVRHYLGEPLPEVERRKLDRDQEAPQELQAPTRRDPLIRERDQKIALDAGSNRLFP